MRIADTTAENPPERAAIYARVSSNQQAQQGTIDSQVESLWQRVQADGVTLDKELCFIDDGFSGSTLVRPALERLRDIASAGGFQRLYVHSPDRLARNYAWQVLLVDELRNCDVELVFLNRGIGTSPEEDLLLQMQGVIAEYERAKIMERSRRGKRHAASRGSVSVLAGAPYGYRYIRKHEGGGQACYQVKLEEAGVVRQMFEWVGQDHLTLRDVVRRLDLEGVPSPRGKGWRHPTVAQLLRNPAYKGQAIFGKSRAGEHRPSPRPRRGKSGRSRRSVSRYGGKPEDQIVIPVPSIVSEALFDAVAEQLEENRKRYRLQKQGPSSLLQGLLECGCCGYAYYGKGIAPRGKDGRTPYRYYRCCGMDGYRFDGKPVCANRPIRLDRLDAAVWEDLRALLQSPDDLRREFERRLDGESKPGVSPAQVDQQIAAIERTINRLIDGYENGLLEKGEFEPRLRHARQRVERLRQEAARAADETARRAELRLVLGQLDLFAEQVRQGLDHADREARRQIIRALVKVVKIEQDQVRIVYRISPRPLAAASDDNEVRQHCRNRLSTA